jgi:hypothetical protein
VRHFYRSTLTPAQAIAAADDFFASLSMTRKDGDARVRTYSGSLGEVHISARPEGGHCTFVEAATNQMGESRLDRNVKKFFVKLHRKAEPRHLLEAAY